MNLGMQFDRDPSSETDKLSNWLSDTTLSLLEWTSRHVPVCSQHRKGSYTQKALVRFAFLFAFLAGRLASVFHTVFAEGLQWAEWLEVTSEQLEQYIS